MWGKQLALDNGQKVHSQNKDPYQKICKWYNQKRGSMNNLALQIGDIQEGQTPLLKDKEQKLKWQKMDEYYSHLLQTKQTVYAEIRVGWESPSPEPEGVQKYIPSQTTVQKNRQVENSSDMALQTGGIQKEEADATSKGH